MRYLLLTLLMTLAPLSWGETWVCTSETYVGAKKAASGSAGLNSKLIKYQMKDGKVIYYGGSRDLPITHNDSRYLIATEYDFREIMGAGFAFLCIDKIKKKHIFYRVHVGNDGSRDGFSGV